MPFVCPIAGDAMTWHHLAHLGLLAVVLGSGIPMLLIGFVRYRASAPSARPGSLARPIAIRAETPRPVRSVRRPVVPDRDLVMSLLRRPRA